MKKEENGNVLECDIVRDLLPLYCDGVVSEKTKEAVEYHLSECEVCQNEKEKINSSILTDDEWKKESKSSLVKTIKKMNKKYMITVTLVSLIAAFVLIAVIVPFLFEDYYTNIIPDEIDVIAVYPYVTEDNTYFVAIFTYPEYYSKIEASWRYNRANFKRELVLEIDAMTNRFSKIIKGDRLKNFTVLVYDANVLRKHITNDGLGGFYQLGKFEKIKSVVFGNETVWTEEMGRDFAVPEFIPYYIDYYISKDSDVISWTFSGTKENTITAYFKDGSVTSWNYDGTRIGE